MTRSQDLSLPPEPAPPRRDLFLRTGPNWTAVIFFGILAALHYANAATSLLAGRWAGYLSLVFGTLLTLASTGIYFFRYEVGFFPATRLIRLRHGIGRASAVRNVRFRDVRAVRLTLDDGGRASDAVIDLLCPLEDIPCPPTRIPRQEALCLAMLMDVPLVKVSSGEAVGEELKRDGAKDAKDELFSQFASRSSRLRV
jgi:hypothetical protein